jgi:hypothetical protein
LCKEETERLRFELKCESLEQDLFDIRDSVMQATGKISKNLGKQTWHGTEDVDKLCTVFVNYIVTQNDTISNQSKAIIDATPISKPAKIDPPVIR